ncbi:uncharacterized protein ARMOST_01407 [Armillaria ostoyae]|uniref:Fungal-type protein kinase domain-containing protein n=1 Tax=Armillaria ostoyae TaxID=47428 RepID=A0A284QNW0_ARMOS|nr:uncharacterized protein ARMOST_01407 [Armillaria ostoyae]
MSQNPSPLRYSTYVASECQDRKTRRTFNNVDQLRETLRKELYGNFLSVTAATGRDPSKAGPGQHILQVFNRIGRSTPEIDIFIARSNFAPNAERSRWAGISAEPKNEHELYDSFREIINEILVYFGVSHAGAIVTDKGRSPDDCLQSWTSPDISIISPKIYTSNLSPDDFKQMINKGKGPVFDYCSMVSPIEVELEETVALGNAFQLGFYARWVLHQTLGAFERIFSRACFVTQHNRMFVLNCILTDETIALYQFDRHGAVRTQSVNIHSHPHFLVRAILSMAGNNLEAAGFDTRITKVDRGKNRKPYVSIVLNGRTFKATGEQIHRYSLRGRGLVVWPTTEVDQSGNNLTDDKGRTRGFVIKIYYRAASKASECSLLRKATDIEGVAKIIHGEDGLKLSDLNMFGPRILDIAPHSYDPTHPKKAHDGQLHFRDRVCEAILLSRYGPSVLACNDAMDRLSMFWKVILAHGGLWLAYMLHRDISLGNILMDSWVKGGAFLIDMDQAVNFAGSIETTDDTRTGTRLYQSFMVLRSYDMTNGRRYPHDHLDDLESFIWAFVYASLHPGGNDEIVHELCDGLNDENPRIAFNAKMALLTSPGRSEVAEALTALLYPQHYLSLVNVLLQFIEDVVVTKLFHLRKWAHGFFPLKYLRDRFLDNDHLVIARWFKTTEALLRGESENTVVYDRALFSFSQLPQDGPDHSLDLSSPLKPDTSGSTSLASDSSSSGPLSRPDTGFHLYAPVAPARFLPDPFPPSPSREGHSGSLDAPLPPSLPGALVPSSSPSSSLSSLKRPNENADVSDRMAKRRVSRCEGQ